MAKESDAGLRIPDPNQIMADQDRDNSELVRLLAEAQETIEGLRERVTDLLEEREIIIGKLKIERGYNDGNRTEREVLRARITELTTQLDDATANNALYDGRV